MTCTVKKNWIITKVLAPVVPLVQEIASSACTSQLSIGYCEDVYYGEYCLGNGGCGTSTSLNNCGSADIYIKNKPTNADNGVTQCGRLTPIPSSECPADPSSLPRCLTVSSSADAITFENDAFILSCENGNCNCTMAHIHVQS
eukprot:m.251951 g.251951  ORF g.251951 m.251951 type:complete len:143 (-) comp16153_c0_seq9:114-542(-)